MDTGSTTLAYLQAIGLDVDGPGRAAVAAAPKPKVPKASAAALEAAFTGGVQTSAVAGDDTAAKPKAPTKTPAKEAKEAKVKTPAKEAPPATPSAPVEELTPAQLAKLSKEERGAYHKARLAQSKAQPGAGDAGAKDAQGKLSKAQRRALQEAQRAKKEGQKKAAEDDHEMLADLKLQGLTEEQAREVIRELKEAEVGSEGDDDDEDGEDETLVSSVRRWMAEQPDVEMREEHLRDFNLKVRFQGHVDTTPPDHLKSILQVIAEQTCAACELTAKLAPNAVAKKAAPIVAKWLYLIDALYGKISDLALHLDDEKSLSLAADALVMGMREATCSSKDAPDGAQDAALVGMLMALREKADVSDEDLLAGCRLLGKRSKVIDKYIEFLEEALESDEEDGDED